MTPAGSLPAQLPGYTALLSSLGPSTTGTSTAFSGKFAAAGSQHQLPSSPEPSFSSVDDLRANSWTQGVHGGFAPILHSDSFADISATAAVATSGSLHGCPSPLQPATALGRNSSSGGGGGGRGGVGYSSRSLFAAHNSSSAGANAVGLEVGCLEGPAASSKPWPHPLVRASSTSRSVPSLDAMAHGSAPQQQQQLLVLLPSAAAAAADRTLDRPGTLMALQQRLDAIAGLHETLGGTDALLGLSTGSNALFSSDAPVVLFPSQSQVQQQSSSGHSGPINIVGPGNGHSLAAHGPPGMSCMTPDSCHTSFMLAMSPALDHSSFDVTGSSLNPASYPDDSLQQQLPAGPVSDMAVVAAQHKLQQMAALEALQQQLQREVVDLLPLM